MSDEYNDYFRNNFKVISIKGNILSIKHNLCGKVTKISKKDYRIFRTCTLCRKKKLYNKYNELVKQKSSDYIFLSVNAKKQSILLKHKKSNKEFHMNYFDFLKGRGCSYCKKMEHYRKRIKEVFDDEYIVLDYTTYLKMLAIYIIYLAAWG